MQQSPHESALAPKLSIGISLAIPRFGMGEPVLSAKEGALEKVTRSFTRNEYFCFPAYNN